MADGRRKEGLDLGACQSSRLFNLQISSSIGAPVPGLSLRQELVGPVTVASCHLDTRAARSTGSPSRSSTWWAIRSPP